MNLIFFIIFVVSWFLSLVMDNVSRKTINCLASRFSELLKDYVAVTVLKLTLLIGVIVALNVIEVIPNLTGCQTRRFDMEFGLGYNDSMD